MKTYGTITIKNTGLSILLVTNSAMLPTRNVAHSIATTRIALANIIISLPS